MTFGVDGVRVRFGDVTALHDVTFETAPGSVTAIIGADGAGKSTLLRCLVGLVEPDEGVVLRPHKQDLGYLPAGLGSWKSLTVDQNISFVGGAYGLSGQALADAADPLLEHAGLTGIGDRLAGQLSGGMRTKLGFCLAMLHSPELVVLDEPTTGVDPVSRVELWRMISDAVASGTSVVMATSYMDEAERAASVVLLDRGRAILTGSPALLVANLDGSIITTSQPTSPGRAWRSGPTWREWVPSGSDLTRPIDAQPAQPDLRDVSIVAALQATEPAGSTR